MISHPSTSGRQRTVEFQALPSRTGLVHRIVSAQLRYWKLDTLIDPAAVGVTELLANAHRLVGPDRRCTVELVLRRDRLTISVRDHDPHLPPVLPPGTLVTDGRGPAPVAPAGGGWGVRARHDGTGKVVWFTLPVPAPAAAEKAEDETPPGPRHRDPLPSPEPLPAPEPLPKPEPLPRAHVSAEGPPVQAPVGAPATRP